MLSIRARSRLKQPATGQSLAAYFHLTLLLIWVKNLKYGKDPTKLIIKTSASNVLPVVEIKALFRSFKHVYLSYAEVDRRVVDSLQHFHRTGSSKKLA